MVIAIAAESNTHTHFFLICFSSFLFIYFKKLQKQLFKSLFIFPILNLELFFELF
jgi:hypothetical protein